MNDLTPTQLQQLQAIRERRRELVDATAREHRELMGIVNAAATRRSEKRHRFMLLAGGIVGVAAPVLLQRTAGVNSDLIKLGSTFLLVTVIVGAVFDAIDDRRTTPLLLKGGEDIRAGAELALAEDAKLMSAVAGIADPELDANIERARRAADQTHRDFNNAGNAFANASSIEIALFFSAFVVGVVCLIFAVGTSR